MCCIVKNGRKKTVFNEFLRVFTGSFAPELVQNQGIGDQGSGGRGRGTEGTRERGTGKTRGGVGAFPGPQTLGTRGTRE